LGGPIRGGRLEQKQGEKEKFLDLAQTGRNLWQKAVRKKYESKIGGNVEVGKAKKVTEREKVALAYAIRFSITDKGR